MGTQRLHVWAGRGHSISARLCCTLHVLSSRRWALAHSAIEPQPLCPHLLSAAKGQSADPKNAPESGDVRDRTTGTGHAAQQ